ncbi:MAG: type II toxin-antitoxin system VapC family toxin [Rhodocyclaceae bacterium]|nr:type II toxin-antitoxin system VapC family toxin [Rhodocyclaceae bacterium]
MSYLLDTNVLSELRRSEPQPAVVDWIASRKSASLYLSTLTLGEIRRGIDRLPESRRRMALEEWLEQELPQFFSERVLPVDAAVADRWGRMLASAGRPVPVIDSLLAATAVEHDLVLVTRNLRDFGFAGLRTFNPWEDA